MVHRPPNATRAVVAVVVASLAITACAQLLGARALAHASPGRTSYHQLRVGDRTRSYILHLPPAAARGRVPLVLVLHGHHSNAAVMRASAGLDTLADRYAMAVAYPEGSGWFPFAGLAWNAVSCCGYAVDHAVDDVGFALALTDTLANRGWVDPSQLFIAGFSAGGMLAFRIACEHADRVVAIANVAGAMPDTACTPSRPVSVLLVRGEADKSLRDYHDTHTNRDTFHSFATSYENAFHFWAEVNRCERDPRMTRGGGVLAYLLRTCHHGTAVELLTIADHPHAWPGGAASWLFAPTPSARVHGSALILAFFARHRRAMQ